MSGSRSRCSFVFIAPLSRRCRCGRHAHVAGYGTGSRHRICLGRTHTSVRTSRAGTRGPSLTTAWAIASGGERAGFRPRAADEHLVEVGQGVCLLPSRKEGGRGARGDVHELPRVYRRDWGASGAVERVRLQNREQSGGAAHVKHGVHVRDAGRVPAQGLVEGPRGLPRVASRAHGAGRAAGRGSRETAGDRTRCARSGQGRGLRLQTSGAKRAGSSARKTSSPCP